MATALTRSDEAEPGARRSLRERLLGVLAVPGRLLGAFLLPTRYLPRIVAHGRYGAALVTVVAAALLAASAIGYRLDVSRQVPTVDGPPGEEVPLSEREIAEKIDKQTSIQRVTMGLGAGLGAPALVFAFAIGLFFLGWFVGGKPTFRRAGSLAAHASLPGAVKSLIIAAAALRQPQVTPDQMQSLLWPPASIGLNLWAVVMVAVGLAAVAGIGRTRAAVATSVGALVLVGIAIILMRPHP